MITLIALQEICELYVSIKSSKGNLLERGDVLIELEEWNYLAHNIMRVGFDHTSFVKYLEYGIVDPNWIS